MVRRAAARLDRDAELLAFHAAAIALARGARASPYAAWQALCTRLRRCGFNAVCLTYGPFRDAVGSASNLGKSDKMAYQMDP
ncbi:hypothetical protein WLX37_22555, partial [Bordetella bronchiseptica]